MTWPSFAHAVVPIWDNINVKTAGICFVVFSSDVLSKLLGLLPYMLLFLWVFLQSVTAVERCDRVTAVHRIMLLFRIKPLPSSVTHV
jgi:hypothetical protein